ncbi:MAG: winged helix-turn-helix domain-containing protein [Phycisphaerales bacterium]|nr:winged helix-turn-helix domain-containing protein [Phycisphaerales bacterium]
MTKSKKTTTTKASAKPAKAVNPGVEPLAEAMKPSNATKAVNAKKAPAEPKAKKTSGLDAAAQVLADAGQPMRCKDMVETMLAEGIWKTGGKTPAATIYAAILREIQTKGSESRFKKTDRGLFTINGK